jgi:hypothetical protein
MTDHDTELVALIDNELDGDAKARLLARLVQDEAMLDVSLNRLSSRPGPRKLKLLRSPRTSRRPDGDSALALGAGGRRTCRHRFR